MRLWDIYYRRQNIREDNNSSIVIREVKDIENISREKSEERIYIRISVIYRISYSVYFKKRWKTLTICQLLRTK